VYGVLVRGIRRIPRHSGVMTQALGSCGHRPQGYREDQCGIARKRKSTRSAGTLKLKEIAEMSMVRVWMGLAAEPDEKDLVVVGRSGSLFRSNGKDSMWSMMGTDLGLYWDNMVGLDAPLTEIVMPVRYQDSKGNF
jgi:hypothetical protein